MQRPLYYICIPKISTRSPPHVCECLPNLARAYGGTFTYIFRSTDMAALKLTMIRIEYYGIANRYAIEKETERRRIAVVVRGFDRTRHCPEFELSVPLLLDGVGGSGGSVRVCEVEIRLAAALRRREDGRTPPIDRRG
ncbi:hypothetical protein Trydic_g7076 [Trypoxylus dichotomus]